MSVETLEELLGRITRLKARMSTRSGTGDIIKSNDEFETTIIVESVKPANEVDDDLAAIFIWLWSVRDYMIAKATEKGIVKSLIDNEIDKHLCLKLCSDIANRQKHGNISKSRSGRFARILKSGYRIPQEAISRISCEGGQTTFAVSHPEKTSVTADIVDKEDFRIIGAIECIEQSLGAWAAISESFQIDF